MTQLEFLKRENKGSGELEPGLLRDLVTKEIYRHLSRTGTRRDQMNRVFGEPRLNKPYPEKELLEDGIHRRLPLIVKTPFKWLLQEPFYMNFGQEKKFLFLHAQKEGGTDWLGGDIECRDIFILTARNKEGVFQEISSLQLAPFDGQYVYRVKELHRSGNHFMVALIESGTYNRLVEQWRKFQIDENGIRNISSSDAAFGW